MLTAHLWRKAPPKVRLAMVAALLSWFAFNLVSSVLAHRALPAYVAPQSSSALSPSIEIVPGVRWSEVVLPRGKQQSRLWVYLPSPLPAKKLPCVFIAPAGTRLFHGIGLGEGDQPEQVPYAQAGFAVVAYELDGEIKGQNLDMDDEATSLAVRAFWSSEAGLKNAQDAIRYALAKLPTDPQRLYAAGHSSAGTMALHLAESEPRIAACVAYAPTTDLEARFGAAWIARMERYRDFTLRSSPIRNVASLKCPTFLFHADDDDNTPLSDNQSFATALHKTNPRVTFVRVPSGDHYTSMVKQGIPRGIAWLKALSTSKGGVDTSQR